jgi:hypothetical protein
MNETMHRLDKLETELADIKARLAKIEPKAEPARAAEPPAQQVRILQIPESPPIILPSQIERQRLRDIVLDFYPQLYPTSDDPDDFVADFNLAFDRIAAAYRTDEPGKYSVGWWTDECRDWGQLRGRGRGIRGGAFIAAVVAAGDVKFTIPDNAGNVWTMWLAPYGGGRRATLAWREVLNGHLLQPAQKFPQDFLGIQRVTGIA